LARCKGAQDAAHDLAAAGLGQGIGEADQVGTGDRADLLAHVAGQLGHQGVVAGAAGLQGHKSRDRPAIQFMNMAQAIENFTRSKGACTTTRY